MNKNILIFLIMILLAGNSVVFSQSPTFWLTHFGKTQTAEINKKFANDSMFQKDSLSDLPLLLFENDTSTVDYFVILLPGDGGWIDFIDIWAKTFQRKGINVVGFNTIPYFVIEKKPEQIAADLQRVIKNFAHALNKKNVMIGGYSYGAEILPFAYNRMDSVYQKIITKLLFCAPSTTASFKVSPNFFYNQSLCTLLLPDVLKIETGKMMFFCDNQKYSLCNVLPPEKKYNITLLQSGHMFLGKGQDVSNIISDTIMK
jgi:type IV secretory pathway VirJ component